MKRLLLLVTLCFSIFSTSKATHIVGGSLTYEHLGGSSYRINLRLYRAADPCDFHVALQNSARVDVYFGSTGAFYQSITVNRIELSLVSPYIDSCAANPPCTEIEQGIFTAVVNNMPPLAGGYHLYFETCCRNSAVSNLVSPGTSGPGGGGEGFYCKVTDNTLLLTNSSPQWKQPPPVFICQGFDIDFDHGATDADGDSLAYSFYTPFSDYDYLSAAPWDITFTAGVPNFVNVAFIPPFSATNPLDISGSSSLSIGTDGVIHGIPPDLGRFAAGVRCDEYRDGVLIGSIYRDFQFNVVYCPPPIAPVIGESSSCDGDYTVTFSNLSSYDASTTFFWDFDLSSPNTVASDTSNATSPTHVYPSVYQCYDVMLVTQPHTKCADTAYRTICVDVATANYNAIDSVCVNTPVTFNDLSTGGPGNPVTSWSWNFGDGSPGSILPSPTHAYTTGGLYNIQLVINTSVGCKDTIIQPLFVQGTPTVNAGPDLNSCLNNPTVTLNGSVTNATGGLWLGWAGTFTPSSPTNVVVDYTPDTSEISAGSMFLILTSTGNGVCPAAFDSVTITFVPGPTVNAGADIQVCRDTSSVQLNGSYTVAGGVLWTTTGSGSFVPNNTDTNAVYIPTAADTAAGCITFYLSTTFNANCLAVQDTMELCFYAPPTIAILADDTVCTGQPLLLSATSTTGTGYWTTNGLGDGIFTPDSLVSSTSTPTYIPGTGDAAAGMVTFIFVSTNNGGCLAQRDTFTVAVIPSPSPSFSTDQVCFGNPTTFTNTSTAVGGISGYQWLDAGTAFSTSTNPTFIFGSEGNQSVSLIVTSTNGCIDTLTQNVMVNYLPNVAFSTITPCLQGGTPFDDNSTVTGSSLAAWAWEFGDGGTSSIQDPIHQYGSSGTYNVTLVVTSAQGCIDSLTQPTIVLPAPTANFTVSPEFANQFQDIYLTDASTPVVSWYWNFGDGIGNSTLQNPTYNYSGSGVYSIYLVVTDTNGCVDTAFREVTIFLPPHVPSGFSPNGSGANDLLFVYGGPFDNLDFKVYNNWGELVFQTSDQATGWDGTHRGVPQPIGVFVWTLVATTPDGTVHEKAGDVTLLR